jgi:SAM-dependent methyltransferase
VECSECQHRYAGFSPNPDHIQEHYGDDYFTGGGAGYDDYLSESQLLEAHGRRYAELLETHGVPTGSLFSVGAAAGFICAGFASAGWQVTGIEPNDSMADFARTVLGLGVTTATLEDFEPSGEYDLVTVNQVMAHFVSPRFAAERLVQLARPGGFILIETWNYRSLTARAFGTHWHEYSPPTVLHWFSPESLNRLMADHGARLVASGRPRKRINGAHARSLLEYKLKDFPLGNVFKLATRVIPSHIEIPYPSEDVFWSLYRVGDV